MPNLSWWQDGLIDQYLDAFRELMLPQTTVLVGNHSTLWRWLLPDWNSDRNPGARDIAAAAAEMGVPYTLVTGIPLPEQFIENTLASPESVLSSAGSNCSTPPLPVRATPCPRRWRRCWPVGRTWAKPATKPWAISTIAWMAVFVPAWAMSSRSHVLGRARGQR